MDFSIISFIIQQILFKLIEKIFCNHVSEMSETDILAGDHMDGLDGLENGQDGDAIMLGDGLKRELNETNIDDPVSFNMRLIQSVIHLIHH